METMQAGGPRVHAAYTFDDKIGRRRLLQFLAGSAAFVGFSVLGLFRNAPRAGAYTEYEKGGAGSYCGDYDPDVWWEDPPMQNGHWDAHGCQDGACVGVMHHFEMGRAYCTDCDEVSAVNPYQWHYSGKRGSSIVMGDRANVCDPLNEGSRDAWQWKQDSCGYCAPAVWRCHDGWKLEPGGFHDLTICQGLVYCNGAPYDGCNEQHSPAARPSDRGRP